MTPHSSLHPAGPLKNQRGVALLMVMSFILIMMFLAVDVSYDSQVEYRVANNDLDRLRAYYAAKSGVEFSLFRIAIFKQVSQTVGASLGPKASMLDLIWQFPFMWPPMVPKEVTGFSKESIEEITKNSLFDAQFAATIEGESGKIDVNDLASPSEPLAKATFEEIVQLLANRLDADDDFARENKNFEVRRLVNNIADWVDRDDDSRNGGSERPFYKTKEGIELPPNQPMKTIEELHMVAGMTDEFYALLAPRLTVYGIKGININKAGKDVLRSIDPQIDDKVAAAIIAWRDDTAPDKGPFPDEDGFKRALSQNGVNIEKFNPQKIPLYFGSEKNFKIKSTGQYGRSTREIIAIVYDFDTVKGRLKTLMTTPTASPTPPQAPYPGAPVPPPTPSPTPTPAPTSAPGRPLVVDWYEN